VIANILDWDGTINWNTAPKRPGEIYYLNSNPTKAKILLGWEPKVSLEEGIKRTIDMLRVG
jgi:nucleoside-diphosphate-sugar epimerase